MGWIVSRHVAASSLRDKPCAHYMLGMVYYHPDGRIETEAPDELSSS